MMRLRTKIAALPLAALAICAALQLQRVEAATAVLLPTIDLSVTRLSATGNWNGTGWDPPTFSPGVVDTVGTTLAVGHGYICDPCNSPGSPLDSRAIVKFDLSSIPGPITGATLTLNQTLGDGDPPPFANGGATLRLIGSSWLPTDAPADIWAVVNNGSSSSLVGSIPNVNGAQLLSNATILTAVQGWQSNPATNQGFGLKQTAEGFTITTRKWASNEFGTAGSRPMLTVEYTQVPEPASAILLMVAAGCVAMLRRRQR